MSNPTCETCRWWQPTGIDDGQGECHRMPPQLDIRGEVCRAINGRDKLKSEGYAYDSDTDFPYDEQVGYTYRATGTWPTTLGEGWCGEHSPMPVVELKADGKLHFHVSGDNVWRADAGTYSFQIAKEDGAMYTAMMYGHEPVACGSYETAVAWCETMLRNHGN